MLKIIRLFLSELAKYEKAMQQIRCLVSDKHSIIEEEINKFPLKKQRYAMYKAYKLALWGYPLNKIIDELVFVRGCSNGKS